MFKLFLVFRLAMSVSIIAQHGNIEVRNVKQTILLDLALDVPLRISNIQILLDKHTTIGYFQSKLGFKLQEDCQWFGDKELVIGQTRFRFDGNDIYEAFLMSDAAERETVLEEDERQKLSATLRNRATRGSRKQKKLKLLSDSCRR